MIDRDSKGSLFLFTKGLHFSEDFGRRDFYNGVREGFFWKTTDLVS